MDITIIYKSGTKVHVKCSKFEVTRYANGGLSLTWADLKPPTLLINPDEIESIWEGKV